MQAGQHKSQPEDEKHQSPRLDLCTFHYCGRASTRNLSVSSFGLLAVSTDTTTSSKLAGTLSFHASARPRDAKSAQVEPRCLVFFVLRSEKHEAETESSACRARPLGGCLKTSPVALRRVAGCDRRARKTRLRLTASRPRRDFSVLAVLARRLARMARSEVFKHPLSPNRGGLPYPCRQTSPWDPLARFVIGSAYLAASAIQLAATPNRWSLSMMSSFVGCRDFFRRCRKVPKARSQRPKAAASDPDRWELRPS